MQGVALLDMCRFTARCGVPPAPFCTLTRDKRKTRSLVPAMGFKNRTAFDLFSSNTNGRVWGFCLLIRSKFSGRKPFCANLPAIHIDCPQSGQISCSRREHIEFAVRQTYRLKDWARTVSFFPFICHGRSRPAALPPCPLKSGRFSLKAKIALGRKIYSTLFSDSIIFTFLTRLPSKKLTANEVTRVMAAEIR